MRPLTPFMIERRGGSSNITVLRLLSKDAVERLSRLVSGLIKRYGEISEGERGARDKIDPPFLNDRLLRDYPGDLGDIGDFGGDLTLDILPTTPPLLSEGFSSSCIANLILSSSAFVFAFAASPASH